MFEIRAYSKLEDAYLSVALLDNAGIEATVEENSATDAALLGATITPNIRLIVAESDMAKADDILKNEELPFSAESADFQTTKRPNAETSPRQEFFRSLVIAELISIALFTVFGEKLSIKAPSEVQNFIDSQVWSESLWDFAYDISFGMLIASVFSSILLFQFISLGRPLFIGTYVWTLICNIAYPSPLWNPIGITLSSFQWILAGAIIIQMYSSPVSDRFRKSLDTT